MKYTYEDKLKAIDREINMRKRVYPRWVAEGRMSQPSADWELSIMDDIRSDYEELAKKTERLL